MLEILQLVGTCVFDLKHWIKGQPAVAIGSIRCLLWALCTLWLFLKVGKDGYLLLRQGKAIFAREKGSALVQFPLSLSGETLFLQGQTFHRAVDTFSSLRCMSKKKKASKHRFNQCCT